MANMQYDVRATVSSGAVRSSGDFELTLDVPRELGGHGGAQTHAEQLLAAGYAACFHNAMEYAATSSGRTLPAGTQVSADVHLDQSEGVFRLAVDVHVASTAGANMETLQALVDEAARIWPHGRDRSPDMRVSLEQ